MEITGFRKKPTAQVARHLSRYSLWIHGLEDAYKIERRMHSPSHEEGRFMRDEMIRISAKNLAGLHLVDSCKRCFWLKLKMRFHLPFQIFPGIFSSIDSYTKRVTSCYFQPYHKMPPWLRKFGAFSHLCTVPHWSVFNVVDDSTEITLTGMPDDILKRRNKSFFIVDYKTAKFTGTQDRLLPLYEAQLNAYAFIAEHCADSQFSPVSGLGLIYFEPQTELTANDVDSILLPDGFHMGLAARHIEIDLEPEKIVRPLLEEARRLADSDSPPNGREGCKDCENLAELFRLTESGVLQSLPTMAGEE